MKLPLYFLTTEVSLGVKVYVWCPDLDHETRKMRERKLLVAVTEVVKS